MHKVLISIPDQLAARMRTLIPPRKRSEVITHLLELELKRREKKLFECARAVEKDRKLKKEMQDWDVTLQDGLEDESW